MGKQLFDKIKGDPKFLFILAMQIGTLVFLIFKICFGLNFQVQANTKWLELNKDVGSRVSQLEKQTAELKTIPERMAKIEGSNEIMINQLDRIEMILMKDRK